MRRTYGEQIETDILAKSRRRCSICYGLNRSTEICQGQIAHLDRDSSNSEMGNLAFLCFDHHDQYDSRTSQSKGFKQEEVRRYRDELYAEIGDQFSQKVHFGNIRTVPSDPYAGRFTRIGTGSDSAEIILTPLPDSLEGIPRYFLSGLALAGSWKPGGPNMGDLSVVIGYEKENIATYSKSMDLYGDGEKGRHEITLRHDNDVLIVGEAFSFPLYGLGVSFEGTYRKS